MIRKKFSPYEKELLKLERDEKKFKEKYADKNESAINRLLCDKVPAGLQNTLDSAFAKAFALVFEKGTGIIEKSYNRDEIEKRFKIAKFTAELRGDRKSLKTFSKRASSGKALNLGLSGAAGMGMGFLGIGIPDIAVFTSLMLKNIYEIALNFGFDYKEEQEQAFILRLIRTAVCIGEEFEEADKELDYYIENGQFENAKSADELIKLAASALSNDLLYTKFLQGIPIVGVVGGAYDAVFMQRIGAYSELKYRKRFYFDMNKTGG